MVVVMLTLRKPLMVMVTVTMRMVEMLLTLGKPLDLFNLPWSRTPPAASPGLVSTWPTLSSGDLAVRMKNLDEEEDDVLVDLILYQPDVLSLLLDLTRFLILPVATFNKR